jgi:hypothetical protein
VASAYLVAQGVLGALWWVALFTVPAVRSRFELMADRPSGLDAYLLADLALFVGGSVAAAAAIWRRSPWATVVASFTAGAVAYATLHLLGWVVLEGTAAIGLVPMAAALVASTAIALGTRGAAREPG